MTDLAQRALQIAKAQMGVREATGHNDGEAVSIAIIAVVNSLGTTLNSIATNVAGAIQLDTLESTYSQASFGPEMEPNYGLCTYLCYSYIKNKFQSQQRSTIGALAA